MILSAIAKRMGEAGGSRRSKNSSTGRTAAGTSTVDAQDIARFERLAETWWDPAGPHAPLHRFVPVRMGLIRDALVSLAKAGNLREPLKGLRVLDIGCGGGLLSEPMTRLGAAVIGVDADEAGIRAATEHAEQAGLAITYRTDAIETLASEGLTFDAVVASEVIEHVADRPAFLDAIASVLRPGGVLVLTTINRTPRSYAVAIVGAEYVLRMVPRGTHDWDQFPKPEELTDLLDARDFDVDAPIGFHYDVMNGTFSETADARVNYGLVAVKRR